MVLGKNSDFGKKKKKKKKKKLDNIKMARKKAQDFTAEK